MAVTKTLGLLVNPVAGMGGSVGLKGTDGEMYQRALELGAEPVTPDRAHTLLAHVRQRDAVDWLVAPGAMGAEHAEAAGLSYTVVGQVDEATSAGDTRRIAGKMVAQGADLLVFVGGDGTARDVYDAIDGEVPVVAVPAGVKVYSAAFALSPRAAAELVDAAIEAPAGELDTVEEEVLDIDEAAFRENRLDVQLYGYLQVPRVRNLLQPGKEASPVDSDVEENKRDIAASVQEELDPETLYLLGPGTTVEALADALEVPKTLLGVDAVVAGEHGGERVGADLNADDILALLDRYPQRAIVVTPLGGNGFLFGRGNQQFTPEVLRRVGREHLIVLATAQKAHALSVLRVDTGDRRVDEMLSGYLEVVIGYRRSRVMRVMAV
jgi:predicted polyphosphate/ATP-dependent NAD kinase